MRRTTEFKGYRSTIEYDPVAGTFAAVSYPEDRMEMSLDESLKAWAQVLPFPEFEPEVLASTEPTLQKISKTG